MKSSHSVLVWLWAPHLDEIVVTKHLPDRCIALTLPLFTHSGLSFLGGRWRTFWRLREARVGVKVWTRFFFFSADVSLRHIHSQPPCRYSKSLVRRSPDRLLELSRQQRYQRLPAQLKKNKKTHKRCSNYVVFIVERSRLIPPPRCGFPVRWQL